MGTQTPAGGEGGVVKDLASLNQRNRDFYQTAPLPQRRKDGTVVDERFPKREEPK